MEIPNATDNFLENDSGLSTSPGSSTITALPSATHHGFEGPEKLLEIWFQRPSDSDQVSKVPQNGFKSFPRQTWVEMLKLVKCEIISQMSTDEVDSYLLSESSMFVFEHKIILKTCGTTTLLACLGKLLELAASIGLETVEYVFYSRKSFMFPKAQVYPHEDWGTEVAFLERYFNDGSAYVVGKTNGDHWHFYLWEPCRRTATHIVDGEPDGYSSTRLHYGKQDHTLELLMCDMDPAVARMFYKGNAYTSDGNIYGFDILFKTAMLRKLFPSVKFDDFAFDPCGYSCNGLSPNGGYLTVHVTPEAHCSYASFETNICPSDDITYAQIVAGLVKLFNPSRFTVTLFAEKPLEGDVSADAHYLKGYAIGNVISGFNRRDFITYQCENYDLFFYHYDQTTATPLSPGKNYR